MDIVVLVKQVPDTYSVRTMNADGTIDRDSADAVIDEIDTKGLETALQLVEEHGGEVTVLTMGPDRATDALRKALAMGAQRAVHIVDDSLAGSDALQTSAALAAAIRTLTCDLVIAGNEASDGKTGFVPAMLAERLGYAQVTSVRKISVNDGRLVAERQLEGGYADVSAPMPAVVSVTEKIFEPRYPSFKGIMAAKKKPITVLGPADLGLDDASIGISNAPCEVVSADAKPARVAGEKLTDDGRAGILAAEYLAAARII